MLRLTANAIMDPRIVREVSEDLQRVEAAQIILDFSNVREINSAMMAVLLSLRERLQSKQGRLVLCGLRPDVLDRFRVMQIDRLLGVVNDLDAALDLF